MRFRLLIFLLPILLEGSEALTLSEEIVRQQLADVRARQEWEANQRQLQEILSASQARLEQATAKIDALQAEKREEQEKLAAIQRQINEAKAQNQATEATLQNASQSLAALFESLPLPLQDKLAPQLKSLNQKESPLPERVRLLLAIYEEIADFDRQIHWVKQLLPDASGVVREHDVIYLGLGAAYAYAKGAAVAGYGVPSAAGYRWRWSKSYRANVQKAVDILSNKRSPEMLSLPLQK